MIPLAVLAALIATHAAPTPSLSYQVHDPRWSPNGGQLAYVVTHGEVDRDGFANPRWRARIWIVGTNGRGAHPLTPRQFGVQNVAWSPDGTAIAYAAGGHLWRTDLHGHITQLTFGRYDDSWWPAWSPDGQKIAFTRGHRFDEGVYWMPSTGGPATQVTNAGERPAWSPDGTFLAIASPPDFVNLDGSPHPVTETQTWVEYLVSPDRQVTAFTNGNTGRVYLRQRSGRVLELPGGDSLSERPVWSTDGLIAYIARGPCGRHSEIRVADEHGNHVRTLARGCLQRHDP